MLASDACPDYQYVGECIGVYYDPYTFPHVRYSFFHNGKIIRYDNFYYMVFRESIMEDGVWNLDSGAIA